MVEPVSNNVGAAPTATGTRLSRAELEPSAADVVTEIVPLEARSRPPKAPLSPSRLHVPVPDSTSEAVLSVDVRLP